jgi:hypothetical protein
VKIAAVRDIRVRVFFDPLLVKARGIGAVWWAVADFLALKGVVPEPPHWKALKDALVGRDI